MVESQSSQKIYQGLCMFLHTSFSQKWYSSMLINHPTGGVCFRTFFWPAKNQAFRPFIENPYPPGRAKAKVGGCQDMPDP